MLKKFFNVHAIFENNSKVYLTKSLGFSTDINDAGNFILFAPFLNIICKIMSNKVMQYRVKKIWMPTVKIDATITPYIARYILENPEVKDGE